KLVEQTNAVDRDLAAVAEDSFGEAQKILTVEQQAKLLLVRRELQGQVREAMRRRLGQRGSHGHAQGKSTPSHRCRRRRRERRRCFVAIDPPDDVRHALDATAERLRAAAPRADVRWVSAQSMHLTLKFLGQVPEDRLPQVREAVETVATAT